MTTFLVSAVIAFFSSVVAILVVLPTATKLGLVDRPDGYRKLHRKPIPLGGGLAVFCALTIAVAIVLTVPNPYLEILRGHTQFFASLWVAGLVLVIVGLIDDRFSMRARHKLVGQVVAISILISTGMSIESISAFGLQLNLGLLAIPFTVFWLLGAINSLNLLDGVDGLATTVGIILAVTTGVLSTYQGHPEAAIVSFVMAGALGGFLCFNFPPARMFLGDAGSMVIGLVIGVVAIRGSIKGTATVALAAPLAVWAIPIFDTTAAIIRRKLTSRSLNSTDRSHFHHCLMSMFGSNLATVGIIAACCGITCVGALIGVLLGRDSYALFTVLAVIGILVTSRMFGYVEMLHIGRHIKAVGRNWLTMRHANRDQLIFNDMMNLGESEEWDNLWTTMTRLAEEFSLAQIRLDISLPYSDKQFHANWQRPHQDKAELWRTEMPILAGEKVVGKLVWAGQCDEICTAEMMTKVTNKLHEYEMELRELIAMESTNDTSTNSELEEADLDDQPKTVS